ncbi:uncharacterized protein TNCV_1191571 [Trichonephila clavipes]|nr:uncharacterized protein TNCV_1191571 [Trichonephila clavipes]
MTCTLPPLLESEVDGGTPGWSCIRAYGSKTAVPGCEGLVLPNINVDSIASHSRFLILSLPNSEMSRKSPFAIQKALKGIGGDTKSVRKLRSGDLLIETVSFCCVMIETVSKSFLLAKTFLDSTLIVTPHKSLNSCRCVISESDLLCTSEAEFLEGLSDECVTQIPSTLSSVSTVSTSSSSIQAHLLPSTSSIKPIIQIESQLSEPISNTTSDTQ